jgi:protein-tyrosine phosphatase
MAEGVFRYELAKQGLDKRFEIDSAATSRYHIGSEPDRRAQATTMKHGIDISGLRGRQVKPSDFSHYDYVLAMDKENLANLKSICPPEYQDRIALFLDHATGIETQEVPDPYYGGQGGFDMVFGLLRNASQGFIRELIANQKQ